LSAYDTDLKNRRENVTVLDWWKKNFRRKCQ